MINGEGIRENSSELDSLDPFDEFRTWQDQKSEAGGDVSPHVSQYSSCGESEFERYCSANSVMGTPSMCSSIGTFQECIDSEFGSMKSFVLDGSLDNFGLGGRSDRKFGDGGLSYLGGSGCLESLDGKNDAEPRENRESGQKLVETNYGLNFCGEMDGSLLHVVNNAYGDDLMLCKSGGGPDLLEVADLSTALDHGLYGKDDECGVVQWRNLSDAHTVQRSPVWFNAHDDTSAEVQGKILSFETNSKALSLTGAEEQAQSQMVIEDVDDCLDRLNVNSAMENDCMEVGRCSDVDNTSSRHGHSEDEDSMPGCGTDDEQKIYSHHWRNMPSHQELKNEIENPFIMNSSVAFGSDDWDDFVQETGEADVTSLMLDKFPENEHLNIQIGREDMSFTSKVNVGYLGPRASEEGEITRDISAASNQVQGADQLAENAGLVTPIDFLHSGEVEHGEDMKGRTSWNNQASGVDDMEEYPKTCSFSSIIDAEQYPSSQVDSLDKGLSLIDSDGESGNLSMSNEEFNSVHDIQVSKSQESEKSKSHVDPLSVFTARQLFTASTETTENKIVDFLKDPDLLPSMVENNAKGTLNNSSPSFHIFDDHCMPTKTENLELNEFYDEVVHDMEEILLATGESPGASFTRGNRIYHSQISLPYRDGGSTASTSGSDDVQSTIRHPLRIDGVEVVGARQKKGDVSLGERLVGVKEYTVYKIRVWRGKDCWEVERRYRDFYTLHCRLKTFFADQGWILPSPWSSVERESRKIFGSVSPGVVAERSALIQECLRSILHYTFSSSPPGALVWFLSRPKPVPSSPTSNPHHTPSPFSTRGTDMENVSTLGKTISLIVEIRPYKSIKQILEAQHYFCAGCHKHFDDGKTRMLEFVQTLGWGRPRLCEYTGQLFCSTCHTNETAVLPARVLHHWDFTQYLVSQLAKSYLDSIHEQPMLCVSAVNPFLFSKVPALQHVMNVRKRIGAMLPYIHCPFRRSIYKGVGSRRYLLESNEFFALRDLIDLSKGAFAALPVMIDTVSRKIEEHITEQCLICCDVGVPCNARQACGDPSSLIFPFQEGDIERCHSCKSVFHKLCFKKMVNCPCGVHLKLDEVKEKTSDENLRDRNQEELGRKESDSIILAGKCASSSTVGFLSGLFSRSRQEKTLGCKDGDTTILMGSLPSTSL